MKLAMKSGWMDSEMMDRLREDEDQPQKLQASLKVKEENETRT